MKEVEKFDPIKYKKMVKTHYENNDPYGWCDSIYTDAKGDYNSVFWADLKPSAYLIKWLEKNPLTTSPKDSNNKAVVIGCGVGDDAQALSDYGYEVTAFDISQEAINLCKKRYPNSKVNYLLANLFDYSKDWLSNFDLIYECNTIQILPNQYRIDARIQIAKLLKLNGNILVSCRSREKGEQEDDIPLPLNFDEINTFVTVEELKEISFLAYDDDQIPSIPHFFACYKRVK
jgi:2-polyprenyl-3-methyl-5-hydroxy-6-metoxy-1,4-benzoquinol methylase